MTYEIRRVRPEEVDAALALAWKTFLQFEAPDYPAEGVETFREQIIDSPEFRAKCVSGACPMWGAFDGERIIGMMGMRNVRHICLVFTDADYQRQGVATAILRALTADMRRDHSEEAQLTLNSAPYGKPFYLRVGFEPTGPERTDDGITYTPMRYALNQA